MTLVEENKFHVPQPFQTFGISEAEDVFRLFQSGTNSGKMAIEMRAQDVVPVRPLDYIASLRFVTDMRTSGCASDKAGLSI